MKLSEYLVTRGAAAELARRIGLKDAVLISQWKAGDRQVPAEHCPAIERETGGKVTCEELRPDIDWAVLRAGKRIHKRHSDARARKSEYSDTPNSRGGNPQ